MEFNLADLFESVAGAIPERTAITCGRRRLTYAQLDDRANRLAHHLAGAGLGRSDHIGIQLCNGTEYVESMLAAFKLRAVPININYRYVEEELGYLFDDSDIVALIHQREFASRDSAVLPAVPRLRHLIAVEDGSGETLAAGSIEYEAALSSSHPARDFDARSADDRYILYTGGTTGLPKGVIWCHG